MPQVPTTNLAAQSSPTKSRSYSASFLRNAIKPRLDAQTSLSNPRQELNDYLNASLEDEDTDIVKWWGVSNHFLKNIYSAYI